MTRRMRRGAVSGRAPRASDLAGRRVVPGPAQGAQGVAGAPHLEDDLLAVEPRADHLAGFGAEVSYQLQKACLDSLDAPIERVTSDDVPMPYAKNLEDEVQPQVKDVVAAVRRVLYLD